MEKLNGRGFTAPAVLFLGDTDLPPSYNSTTLTPPTQEMVWPRSLLISERLLSHYTTCTRASSLFCLLPDDPDRHLIGVTCKTWSCSFCSRMKIRRLAALTKLAGPNRLLTLTIDPKLYASPRQAFESTASFVPELIRYLRKKFGEVEYMRVTEVTKSGFPHYHLLVRSGFLPHAVVKKEWESLTCAKIVDLRQVRESFGAYSYLVKYLTKMHKLDWTERHVSYSRSFFPKDAMTPPPKVGYIDLQRDKLHPYAFLCRWYRGIPVTQIGPHHWRLNVDMSDAPSEIDYETLGVHTICDDDSPKLELTQKEF